jgi:hypothetical protein
MGGDKQQQTAPTDGTLIQGWASARSSQKFTETQTSEQTIVFPQTVKPPFILADLMYDLKPVPFKKPSPGPRIRATIVSMTVAIFAMRVLEVMFFLGLIGSSIVVVISFIEDGKELFGKD